MAGPPGGFKVRQRAAMSARARPAELSPNLQRYVETAAASLAEPFRGITTDGTVVPGLFPVQSTGISTQPLKDAAIALLDSLTPEQRARASFSLEAGAWRQWSNIHPFLMRHGVSLDEMTPRQRDRALALLRATLTALTARAT